MTEEIPKFPDIVPDSITKTMVFDVENDDIRSPEDLDILLRNLWAHTEADTYLFVEKEAPINFLINAAYQAGRVLFVTTEMFWYRHPKLPRDFVRIRRHSNWEWEREVAQTQPMYRRITLALSERERRRRDLLELQVGLKNLANNEHKTLADALSFKPSLWGVGVDLKTLYRWARGRLLGRK